MAFSYTDTIGDGITKVFTFRFEGDNYGYFRASDIHVYVAGTQVPFTLLAPNQVELSTAPVMGSRVLIRRIMPKNKPYTDWQRGNDFGARTVNNSFLQMLYMVQELYDGFMTDGFRFNQNLSMGGYKITDLADGTDPNDAVNYKQLMQVQGSAGDSANIATAAAAAAKVSETNAKRSEDLSFSYRDDSRAYMTSAAASAASALTAARDAARSKADAGAYATESKGHVEATLRYSELSKAAAIAAESAKTSSIAAARFSSSEADRAKREADRAFQLADSVDTVAILKRLLEVEGKAEKALPKAGGTMTGKLILNADATEPLEAVTKKQLESGSGVPIGSTMWWHNRALIPAGWIPSDGQLELRAQYPDLFEHVHRDLSKVFQDTDWLGNPNLRGNYTWGTSDMNFRVPDLNGKQSGSRAVVLRGDGTDSAVTNGDIQQDAIRNFYGSIPASVAWSGLTDGGGDGVFKWIQSDDAFGVASSTPVYFAQTQFQIDASRQVPTANENRMVNATGCFIIRAYGTVINQGVMDAAKLEQAIGTVDSRVTATNTRIDGEVATINNKITNNTNLIANTNANLGKILGTNGLKWNVLVDSNHSAGDYGGRITLLSAPKTPQAVIQLAGGGVNADVPIIQIFSDVQPFKGAYLSLNECTEGINSKVVITTSSTSTGLFQDNGGSMHGWRRLPDGYIEQWGLVAREGFEDQFWVAFHFPFPREICNVQLNVNNYGNYAETDLGYQLAGSYNTAGMSVFSNRWGGGARNNLMWKVVGR